MNKKNAITFFYPSCVVAGTEFLFARLAKELSDQGYDVSIIDYVDGFMANLLKDTDVRLIPYERNITKVNMINIEFETCLIVPLSFLKKVTKEIIPNDKVKVLFWCIQPHNLVWNFRLWNYFKHLTSKQIAGVLSCIYPESKKGISNLLSRLHNLHSLLFMDEPNFSVNKSIFDLPFDSPNYLPIPIHNKSDNNSVRRKIQKDEINVAWLGRISIEKVHALIKIIDDADEYSIMENKKINIHIIGTGESEYMLKEKVPNIKVRLVLLGTMIGRELDKYLLENVDVLFATGTSCLEGAQLKIPSVMVDPSFTPYIREYKYTWLFERENYSLGNYVNEFVDFKGHTFSEIIDILYKNATLGDRCYEYNNNNHSLSSVVEKLKDYINKCSVNLKEIAFDSEYSKIEFVNELSKIFSLCFYQAKGNICSLEILLTHIQREFLKSGYRKIALYASGGHTEKLLKFFHLINGIELCCIIDSNGGNWGKQIEGIEIISLNEAIERGVQAILISSYSFEEQIYKANIQTCNMHNIRLCKLYGYNNSQYVNMIWDEIGF
ncbi:hypothetical protein [Pelosinus fermentans]|uniref:Uncharacterized protein n=1 Tax=Pelosinus fermentans JBW45 TaxID=1192197 RepID=I8TW63_9FIRM|nr:hypothetical protein [Pelosinus fermentans]AJQ26091.1 hypothetical protein JBW_00739 [Pelosinus fermentans JBW45]